MATVLASANTEADAGVLAEMCFMLGQWRATEAGSFLERMAEHDHAEVRAAAVLALGKLADDTRTPFLVAALDDPGTRVSITAERAFLAGLEGDCSVPLAAFAESRPGKRIRLRGLVASPDGRQLVRADVEAPRVDAASAGARAAEEVLSKGAAGILEAVRREAGL